MWAMIAMAVPLAVGNAVRLQIRPVGGARLWRVLRKATDDFLGPDDAGAYLVHQGDEKSVVDAQFLQNGVTYYYRAYFWTGSAWVATPTVSSRPEAGFADVTPDVLQLVRDRVDYGLRVEVERGTLGHENGALPVLTAPPVFEDSRFPLVTVQLQSESPVVRGIGEMIATDVYDDLESEWTEFEGWRSRVQLAITGWSLNPDERIELRKALRRIVLANLTVLDAFGITDVEFQQQDSEDFETYAAPVYQTMGTLSCVAPVAVADSAAPISTVVSTVITSP